MRKTTLLFDFDFTLADSSQGVLTCVNHALEILGYQKHDYETIKLTIGHSLEETFRRLTGENNAEKEKQFITYFVQMADKIMNDKTFVYPEVFALMPKIKDLGFKTGIISTKYRYRIDGVLKREKINHYFDTIVGGEDVKNHKPNPEGLYLAMKNLNAMKKEVIYVGDSLVDAQAAKDAQVDFIAILTGTISAKQFQQSKSKHILDNLNQLLDYLNQNFT